MTVGAIQDLLNEAVPEAAALSWDNSGLLVGDREWEVKKVYLALDATDQVIDHAVSAGADMIITHHPLIFGALKRVTAGDYVGKRVIRLVEHHMALYAMHTDFDIYAMGPLVGSRLGLSDIAVLDPADEENPALGIGGIGTLPQDLTLEEYALFVKTNLFVPAVKVFGDVKRKVSRIAFLPGSGKSDIDMAVARGADCMVTGDVDHHSGLDAVEKGIAVIDPGHWGMEHFFTEYMDLFLKGHTGSLETVCEPYVSPFAIY